MPTEKHAVVLCYDASSRYRLSRFSKKLLPAHLMQRKLGTNVHYVVSTSDKVGIRCFTLNTLESGNELEK